MKTKQRSFSCLCCISDCAVSWSDCIFSTKINIQTPHYYYKTKVDLETGTDFTPIIIQPDDFPDVVVISDRTPSVEKTSTISPAQPYRAVPTKEPVSPTVTAYSLDEGSGSSTIPETTTETADYFMELADLFETIDVSLDSKVTTLESVNFIFDQSNSHWTLCTTNYTPISVHPGAREQFPLSNDC